MNESFSVVMRHRVAGLTHFVLMMTPATCWTHGTRGRHILYVAETAICARILVLLVCLASDKYGA